MKIDELRARTETVMTDQHAYTLADQALTMMQKRSGNHALWLIGDSIQRTGASDFDIGFMEGAGGKLVGVFNTLIGRRDLAEAIMEAAAWNT